MRLTLLAFVGLFALTAPSIAGAKAAATVRDWSRTVAATPEGGFRMGNPAARVKLVEFGSLTCPHCQAFDQAGVPTLIDTYVKSGQVSYEYRSYVRDALDMAAALVARCGGAKTFFPVARALYDDQPAWTSRVENAPSETIDRLRALPKERLFQEVGQLAGLPAYTSAKGIAVSQTGKCLADMAMVDRLAAATGKVKEDYPDFAGTPSFTLNGKLVSGVYDLDGLHEALKGLVGR